MAQQPKPREPLKRLSLHEAVTDRLRDMVLEGELPPGSRIPEMRLCDEFGVSRTPLREALKVLANEGLVRLLPNRGAVVAEVTLAEVADLFEVMVGLEGLSGRLLAERISDDGIAEIRALHERMVGHHDARERTEYFHVNQQIHHRLTEIAGNTVLLDVYDNLSVKVRRARYLANMQVGRWDESLAEHERILDALTRRDGDELSREMSEHMRHTGDAVLQGLREIMTETAQTG